MNWTVSAGAMDYKKMEEHMDEQIKSNLALQIAQLSLDKATWEAKATSLQAQVEDLQAQINDLTAQLEEATAPATN